jgi:phage tail-like protein
VLATRPPASSPGGALSRLTPEDRRGAAADRYGSWYWISADRARVLVRNSGDGVLGTFWPVPDPACPSETDGTFRAAAPPPVPAPRELAGLAVTDDHHLVVGVRPGAGSPGGLLVFDLLAGGPPEQWTWPPDVPFDPFDMAASRGGVLVLDRAHRRLWELDRRLLVVPGRPDGALPATAAPVFTPPPDEAPAPCARSPLLRDAMDLSPTLRPDAPDPVAVEAAPDGTVLLLLAGGDAGALTVLRNGRPVGSTRLPVAGHDLALLPARAPDLGRVFVVDRGGDRAHEWLLSWDEAVLALTVPEPRRDHPLRLFGGKALVAAGGRVHHDLDDRFVPVPDRPAAAYATSATVETDVLDGDELGCVWHRLLVDGCFPGESRLEVWTAAGDDRGLLLRAPEWRREPDPRPRVDGPELPHVRLGPRMGTVETLLQAARGRYLRLRIRITGNGRTSPRLRAVRVWFPRFSYLERYLPAVYGEDGDSAFFLDRFLANPEGMFTVLEDRIGAAHALLDPRVAPAEALEWLASWFDLVLDPAWDEPRRRMLLRHTAAFFAARGTVRGLRAALALVLDPCAGPEIFVAGTDAQRGVRVVELYRTRLASSPRWTSDDGAAALHERWAAELGSAADPTIRFPLASPPGELGGVWTAFARAVLGFVPDTGDAAVRRWRELLVGRYGSVAAARAAHGLPAGPDDLPLPSELPDRDPALGDWYRLHALVLPAERTAHRFLVLLPVPVSVRAGSPAASVEERTRRLALARRILDVEKPAHTVFDVRFYWDAFRIGEARLGLDTIADLGGRSPDLVSGLVLGSGHVGIGRLNDRRADALATRTQILPGGLPRPDIGGNR